MDRRQLFKWAIHGLGAVFAVVLGIPIVGYLIDPRNRAAAASKLKRVAKLGELEIGRPTQAVVRDVRRDAWTLHPNEVIGRVWLLRRDESKVDAYTTICPHLGGSINFEAGSNRFVCPLHGATFNLACARVPEEELGKANPAPRDMDQLECKIEADEAGAEWVAVEYQRFYQGRPDKVVKT